MDLELNPDQRALHDAIVAMVDDHMDIPLEGGQMRPVPFHYADGLDGSLSAGEFYGVARMEGCGAVEATLLAYEACRSPQVLEVAFSAIVAPLLVGEDLPRPVAVARLEDLPRMVRWLDRARTLIVDLGHDVAVLSTEGLEIEPIAAMYAYPVGRLRRLPDFAGARMLGPDAPGRLRRLWQLAIAIEAAAALQAAVDFTTAYVKERAVFGRPVGSFQAVQHRLAVDAQKARGAYWLAMKAAWSGSADDATIAALFAQQAITQVNYDAHQFNGALGMTLEHYLHFWTFRLRLLQGELGGARVQAADLASIVWGEVD